MSARISGVIKMLWVVSITTNIAVNIHKIHSPHRPKHRAMPSANCATRFSSVYTSASANDVARDLASGQSYVSLPIGSSQSSDGIQPPARMMPLRFTFTYGSSLWSIYSVLCC
jgi:hypothetical protein